MPKPAEILAKMSQPLPELTLVIQAGGESRRMGQDKALLLFRGQPLIKRLIERLSPLAQETVIATNRPAAFAAYGLRTASDARPGLGALNGLYTALHSARYPFVAVVACDMPFANPKLLAYQAALLGIRKCDAVVPRSAEGWESFHAVYRRDHCLPLIEKALKAEKRRVDAWFSEAEMCFMLPDEVRRHDPSGLAFVNVNTPEEFAAAEAMKGG